MQLKLGCDKWPDNWIISNLITQRRDCSKRVSLSLSMWYLETSSLEGTKQSILLHTHIRKWDFITMCASSSSFFHPVWCHTAAYLQVAHLSILSIIGRFNCHALGRQVWRRINHTNNSLSPYYRCVTFPQTRYIYIALFFIRLIMQEGSRYLLHWS